MTTKQRKSQAGTVTSQLRAMVAAAQPLPEIPPHLHVRDRDRQFLDVILRSRLREEWTGPDLVVAVQLARVQADIEVNQMSLDREGSMVTDRFGEEVINPRQRILDKLEGRQLALMRALRLAGTALPGDKSALVRQRRLQKQAEDVRNGLSDEELLA